MTRADARTIVAQAVIAGAVCIGAYAAFVEPVQRDLEEARAVLAKLSEAVQETERIQANLPVLMHRLERVSDRIRRIEARGSAALDDGTVFSSLMALASETGVRIDSLEPRARKAGKRSRDAGDVAPPSADAVIAYSMAISGSFADLLVFLDRLPARAGFTRIDSVSVAPDYAGGPGDVLAAVESTHFSFDPRAPQPDPDAEDEEE